MFKNLLLKGGRICLLALCIFASLAAAAQMKISGKVIGSEIGKPVAGATVKNNGTNKSTVTDANGNFQLTAKKGDGLLISYVGAQTRYITVAGEALGVIAMESSKNTLNEVVVTGYSSHVKKILPGQ